VTHCKNTLPGYCTKLREYSVPIKNVHLVKRQVKRVSFSYSSEHQQGVRISYLGWQTVPGAHCWQKTLGHEVWYVELMAIAASDCQQNADDNEQQGWWTDVERQQGTVVVAVVLCQSNIGRPARTHNRNWIRSGTRSQCSSRSSGVMWSYFFAE